jgi:hypothetical protein
VNPSYGGLVSYPTVPTTCSGSLPVFLAGWPNTQEYVCVNGVPYPIGGAGSGVGTFIAPSGSWPSWLVPTVTNPTTTPSLAVAAGIVPTANGGTGATTAAGALANLGGLPLSGGTLTGALNGTSASFSGAVAAGSETLGSPLLPASGGTGATTAAGAWASITNGSQTGSGTSQLNTLPGTSSAVNFNFTGDSSGAIGVTTANSSWYKLAGSIGYGVSTNVNGGIDIMANQAGQSVRLWAGTANTAPTEVASFLNTGSVIYENLQVQGTLNNANGPVIPQTALGTQGPAAGYVTTSISGTATLVSGTVTVSSTAACAVSSSCHYSLTRYATNSSVAIGNLSVGTISAGSSFVINSLTATDTIATTDVSSVSWQVN